MKLVKLFNKLSAVVLAASLVVGFASCSTTTDDPFNPNAPLTLEEYVKSEMKKAIENGGAQAKPEDPSELEFESRTSLMDKIQLNNEKTEDAWGNGTKISSANPLQASEGYGWDKENGQISLPFAYDAGYFGENTHIIIEADDSALNYNADAAIKIEFKVENPSTGHSNEMNITSKFKDGVAIIPISEIGFTDSCQFLLTFRAKGTVTITKIEMAKAKGQSAPEPTPGGEEKPGENPTPTPDEKPEPGKTPGEEYEAGNSTVTSIKLVKNEYAAGGALQTQIKIPSELTSLLVGDKVKVAFKGTADREIGNVELMIVDTTEDASYWTALSETKKDTFSTEINFDFEFEITKAPIGTGENSMVLAINGLDSDAPATITCTSFSIEKNADKKTAGGEEPTPTPGEEPTPTPGEEPTPTPGEEPTPTPGEEPTPAPGEEPAPTPEPEPTPDPKPEDSGLLSKAADLDWGTPVSVAGSSFASATDDSSIKITYVSNADNDYHKFKMMCGNGNENELFAGEATGFTIDKTSENENDLHGCDFAAAPSETPAVITYKPSTEEWTKIKDGEFRLIGHGAKITKVELEAAAGGENNAGGEGDNGAGESTSKTYGLCKKYTVTTTKDVVVGDFAFVLQIDNDGEQSADGLKIDVTDFEMEVQVGDEKPFTYKNPKIQMIPNEWASPAFGVTDCRFKLDGEKTIPSGTVITVQVTKATVSNKAKADSIIYVFNEDGVGGYNQYVAPSDNYKSIFAANEI